MRQDYVANVFETEPQPPGAIFRPATYEADPEAETVRGREMEGIISSASLPAMDEEEEFQKFSEYRRTRDQGLREELIRRNMRLVPYLCARIKPVDTSAWEVKIAGGLEGLVIAVDRFDPDKGFKFCSYALWWIRERAQRRYWQENRNTIYGPGPWAMQRWSYFEEIRARLEQKKMRSVTDTEVIEHIEENNITLLGNRGWWQMLQQSGSCMDWNASCPEDRPAVAWHNGNGDDKNPLIQRLEELHENPEAEDILAEDDQRALVVEMLEELSPEHREIIERRYGLVTGAGEGLKEIAETSPKPEGGFFTKQAMSLREHKAMHHLQNMAKSPAVRRRAKAVLA